MRKLSTEQRAQILHCLVEGVSVNATARMCRASKITVLRLLADAGQFCADYHDLYVRNVAAKRIQCDEIWGFCGCKDKALKAGKQGYGSIWTWTAIDADSKLCIGYLVGARGKEWCELFMRDMAARITGKPQLTTDGHHPYIEAVEGSFQGNVDYAQLIKVFGKQTTDENHRYSPAPCLGCTKQQRAGKPDPDHISTSYVERQNLTIRMGMRRLTRLTNAFSKKFENHAYAIALHFFFYNWIRKHSTLKTTPAVAAGLANKALTLLDLMQMIEAEEAKLGGRLTNYLASPKDGEDSSK